MIIPTLWVDHFAAAGSDIYGQPRLTSLGREKVAPIKLQFDAQHSTVRTDSGASHGHASEMTANVVLLAVPATRIVVDSVLVVTGNKVKVTHRETRYRVTGEIDHYELRCVAWA